MDIEKKEKANEDSKKELDLIKQRIINTTKSLPEHKRLKVLRYAKKLSNHPLD